MDFLDFTSEFKIGDMYKLELLESVVDEGLYFDNTGTEWVVSCSDRDNLERIAAVTISDTNPVNESLNFSTNNKNYNRNYRCIFRGFKFFKSFRNMDKKNMVFTLILENGKTVLTLENDVYVNRGINDVTITFTHKTDVDERLCFCMNHRLK